MGELNDEQQIREIEARQVSAGSADQRQDQRAVEGGTETTGAIIRHEHECVPERTRIRQFRGDTAIGGILKLFLEQEREKLQNADECLQWYERERKRALDRIAELEDRLKNLEGDQ